MRGRTWMVRGMGCVLVLACAGGAFGQADKPAAVVNGEVIPTGQVDALLKQNGPTAVPITESERRQQRQMALDALINETLMRQFLKQNTPPVDPKEVAARMGDLVAGLKLQNKTVADFCREMNRTEAQLLADVAAVIQWNKYAEQHVNDRDVEKFYLDNKDFFDKVLVRASEIMLRVPPQAGDSERAHARSQLAELRNKLVATQDPGAFAAAAKQFSQGVTRDLGGDLDYFPYLKGILPDGVLKAAFTLQPGQISEVIDTEFGVHLIKVVDRKAGEASDFAKIKSDVRLAYIDEMKQVIVSQLRKDAKIQISQP